MRIKTTLLSEAILSSGFLWCAQFDWYDGYDQQPIGWGENEEDAVLQLLVIGVAWNGDGSDQDEITDLAFAGWKATQPSAKET